MDFLEKQYTLANELVQTLPLPSFRYGSGMIANLSSLDFQDVLEKENSGVVRIHAPSEIQVQNLGEWDPKSVEKYLQGLIKPTENRLLAAQFREGSITKVIVVPPKSKCSESVDIFVDSVNSSSFSNIIIVVGSGSQVHITETIQSQGTNLYQGHSVQLYIEDTASVTYSTIQQNSPATYQFVTKRARVGKDSSIRFVDVLCGSKFSQLLLETKLAHIGARAQSYVLYYGDENQVFDIDTQMMHLSQQTHGTMLSHGALKDISKVLYRGNIHVAPESFGVSSTQKSNTLIVGEKAQCNAVPILDVHNDDVICSHGAAMGQVDEALLYYLESRGIRREDAICEILFGMFEPIISQITTKNFQEKVRQILVLKGGRDE